jgi:polyisoprenyl-teichoic acid--peptidoglycan teichoic acid transferase
MSTQVAPPRHRSPGARRAVRPNQRGRHISSRGDGFGRFAGVTVASLVPGAGLVAVGRRRAGMLLLGLTVLALAGTAAVALSGRLLDQVVGIAVSPSKLLIAAAVAVLVPLVWCLTILASAWRARPERPTRLQAIFGLSLVSLVCFAVAAPGAVGANYALITRGTVISVFGDQGKAPGVKGAARAKGGADPWADTPRVNLLLLGSDAGADRTGVRTDSMIVASINTKTGDALLIGLPRSLQKAPFPESNPLHQVWPDGFNCGDECLLNAVWDQAATVHKDLFPGNPNPGLTSTRDVIGEITGLRIDAYSIIDLRGFQSLVDAMGGVDVNVPRRIPIGGKDSAGNLVPIKGYIEPGKQHLNGYRALWFSRSRLGADDYDRMRRQRCMVSNLVSQVNPVQLLGRYPQLAKVFKENIQTDVQPDQLQAWVTLVQRMKKGKITSLPFTSSVINTVDPDYPAVRDYIAQGIDPQSAGPTATTPGDGSPGKPKPTKPSTPGGGPSTDSTQAQDVNAVC